MPDTMLKSGQEVFLYRLGNTTDPLGTGRVSEATAKQAIIRVDMAQMPQGGRDLLHRELFLRWDIGGLREECPVIVSAVRDDTLVVAPRSQERREFLRIQARLPLFYEVVPPERTEAEVERVLSGTGIDDDVTIEAERFWHSDDLGEKMEEQFNQLSRFLGQVDAKLDYLIALAEGREAPQAVTYQVFMIDISGAGLSFVDTRQHELGTLLRTRVQINRFPLEELVTLSKVVRCLPFEGQSGRYEVGVRFETVRGADRERIFRFISRAERTILRQRKEQFSA